MTDNQRPGTISELIQLLESIQRSYGDLDISVKMDDNTPISEVCIELVDYGQDEEVVICGYGW